MSEDTIKETIWKADNTHPDISSDLRDSLREVIDPEIGLNIIELGLVRDVIIEEEKAQLTMILTTPFCPYGPAMLDMTRNNAQQSLNLPTTIEMGMEMWDLSMMEEGVGGDWGMY